MIGSDGHVYRDKPLPEPDDAFTEAFNNSAAARPTWKDEFYAAVKNYINENHNAGAVEVTDVYDVAYPDDLQNSLGYTDVNHTVDITYNTVKRNGNLFTYSGRFASLIESIT